MTTRADDAKRDEPSGDPAGPLAFARRLRRDMTIPERKLWQALRTLRRPGLNFRRQVPMGSFILDFFDAAHKLAVEVDGRSHDDRAEPDRVRQSELERRGLTVIRVSNDEVLEDVEAVVEGIVAFARRMEGRPASGKG